METGKSICKMCGKEYPLFDNTQPIGRHSVCFECSRVKMREFLKLVLSSGNKMAYDEFIAKAITELTLKNKVAVCGTFFVSGYVDIEAENGNRTVIVNERGQQFINGEKLTPRKRLAPRKVVFVDYQKILEPLRKAYDSKQFVLMIGEKGTGKTTAVMKFAQDIGENLFQINCSLRTREHNFIGRWEIRNGNTKFIEGVLPRSMRAGGILYIDEINQAEPDVLIKLAEALDDRRQLTYDGKVVKARPNWFVIATINPLRYVGTKELPPQILSRLPARLYFRYPNAIEEKHIVKKSIKKLDDPTIESVIKIAQKLRTTELQYVPCIRETLCALKLIETGATMQEAIEMTMLNGLYQYSDDEVRKAKELIISLGAFKWNEAK